MKRTLSILLTIAMIISLIPAVFAADVPTMSTTVDKTEVQPGDTITLTLSIDKTITNLNNWEWAIYFDKTAYVKTSGELEPGCMSGTGTTGAVGDNVDILGKNAIRVSGLSTTGDPVTLNAGKIATVTFTATENITAENARIEVKTEALPDYDTLKDNDVKLTGNIIDVTVKSSEAKGYTVSMGADKQVASGQIVEIPVTIGNNDGKNAYNAYDMTFSFDPTILTLNMEATSIEGYRVIPGSGTVRIVRYGKAAELGDALTLNFTAAGQGQSAVKVTAAYVDTNTNAIELDAPAAIVLNGTTTITVNGYTVTLPDDFTRTDATGSVIEAGGNLTFVPKDPNYDYTVTVTVGGGEATTVSPDENGIYTVANVNGNVGHQPVRMAAVDLYQPLHTVPPQQRLIRHLKQHRIHVLHMRHTQSDGVAESQVGPGILHRQKAHLPGQLHALGVLGHHRHPGGAGPYAPAPVYAPPAL